MDKLNLFIHGHSVPSTGPTSASIPVLNKATGETIARVPESTAEDVTAALESAQVAFHEWRQKPAHDRANLMRRAAGAVRADAERLAQLLTLPTLSVAPIFVAVDSS